MQMTIVPSTAVRKYYNAIAEQCRESGLPVFFSRNGTGDLAAMDVDTFFRKERELEFREWLIAIEEKRRAGLEDVPAKEVSLQFQEMIRRYRLLELTEESEYPARGSG